jgi:hypothetical protein
MVRDRIPKVALLVKGCGNFGRVGAVGEPASTRARLESVIPTPAAPAAKKAQPQPPPKPVPPPLWLSGQLPAIQRGRGAGGQSRGSHRGGRGIPGQRGQGDCSGYKGAGRPSPRGGLPPTGPLVKVCARAIVYSQENY